MKKIFLNIALLLTAIYFSISANNDILDASKNLSIGSDAANILLGLRTMTDNKEVPAAFGQLCAELKMRSEVPYDIAIDGLRDSFEVLEKHRDKLSPNAYGESLNSLQGLMAELISNKACASCGPCMPAQVCPVVTCPPPCPPCNPCIPTCLTTGSFNTDANGNPVNQSGLNFIVVNVGPSVPTGNTYQIIFITPFQSAITAIVTATGPGNTSEVVWLSGVPTNNSFTITNVLPGSFINFLVAPAT